MYVTAKGNYMTEEQNFQATATMVNNNHSN